MLIPRITEEMLMTARKTILLNNEVQLLVYGEKHILPCPFCNSSAKLIDTMFGDSNNVSYSIECEKGHQLDSWVDSQTEAINYWNKRE